jgi:hypothetical protein
MKTDRQLLLELNDRLENLLDELYKVRERLEVQLYGDEEGAPTPFSAGWLRRNPEKI